MYINGHHKGPPNSLKMLKSGHTAICTHVSKWTISQELCVFKLDELNCI